MKTPLYQADVNDLKEFLDEKVILYNKPEFIESDPIQVPHLFNLKEDIEIAGFLAATIAWGNRKMIISNAKKIMVLMGDSPYDFVMSHNAGQLDRFENFVHRTFNSADLITFIRSLRHIYTSHGGMEAVFIKHSLSGNMQQGIHEFKKIFFEAAHQQRTQKHVSDPVNGSAAKRINMLMKVIIVAVFVL